MILFPNAKINIGLNITKKRKDGYHNIESIFYPIPIKDALEIVLSDNSKTELNISGLTIDGNIEDNLVIKAYRLLEKDFHLNPVHIYMEKAIPFGAGLGGGSADAAFMIRCLNHIFELNLDNSKLSDYAKKLGADCTFFIKNKPAFASGIGDILTPVELSLSSYFLVLIKPNVFISTKEAYALVKPKMPSYHLYETIQKPVSEWKNYIENDFEASIFPAHPEIKRIKDRLYKEGALYASMSGSGSSVYGLFSHPVDLSVLFPDMYVFQQSL